MVLKKGSFKFLTIEFFVNIKRLTNELFLNLFTILRLLIRLFKEYCSLMIYMI